MEIEKIDKNMEKNENTNGDMTWHCPMQAPFRIAGFPWISKEAAYRRLPKRPKGSIPESVDSLANCTAGGQTGFRTNSSNLAVKVRLTGAAGMYHMPATGQCGFDCYIGQPGKQRFCSITRYDHREAGYECLLFSDMGHEMKSVTLNFPLYMGVKEVKVGLEPDAFIAEPPEYSINKPLVFYGTSITQGGCASRPGMAYTNILSRRLNAECINLGFSGSGKGEPEVARLIAEIENPACIVLDYEANAASGILERTLRPFISILRETHPAVPILVVSAVRHALESFSKEMLERRLFLKDFQQNTVESLKREGDRNIYFLDGSTLFGDDFDECTVDGCHPTDLGFSRVAEGLEPVLRGMVFQNFKKTC